MGDRCIPIAILFSEARDGSKKLRHQLLRCSDNCKRNMKLLDMNVDTRDGARSFPTVTDSSDEGAKIWFSGYYKCQKSPKR